MAWSHKIVTQIETVSEQHVEDEERFHKIQLADQNNFQERIDSLQVGGEGTASTSLLVR